MTIKVTFLPFWPKTGCILAQNGLHFGPKRVAFWAKTDCILRQNGLHFAAKRVAFCGKMDFKNKTHHGENPVVSGKMGLVHVEQLG